jgi:polyhydroxybutyrate depolymerase
VSRWLRSCAALLTTAALVSGCSGSSGHNEAPLPFPVSGATGTPFVPSGEPILTASPPPPLPPPCGVDHPAASVRLTIGGVARTALVAVPPGYDGRHRMPVIVGLHGYDQKAAAFDAYAKLRATGTAMGAIVAIPQGVGKPPGWNVPNSKQVGPSDVRFLDALLTRLDNDACGDAERHVFAGLSDGSDMAVTTACALSDRVQALLLVAASTGPSPRCKAVDVVQVHGTADPIDAYTGRPQDLRRGFGSVKAAGAERAFALWAKLASCRGRTVKEHRDLRTFVAIRCTSAHVRLIAVQGGGHTWPGATPRPRYGATTRSLSTRSLLRLVFAQLRH